MPTWSSSSSSRRHCHNHQARPTSSELILPLYLTLEAHVDLRVLLPEQFTDVALLR